MVDFLPDEEQELVIRSAREFLASELPVDRLGPSGKGQDLDAACWGKFSDLGWFGIALPESAGGAGYSIAEEILVFRECGRFLVSDSVLGTALAARVVAFAGDVSLLERLLQGKVRANIALPIGQHSQHAEADGEFFRIDARDGDLFVIWNDAGMGVYDAAAVSESIPAEGLHEAVAVHRLVVRGSPVAWAPSAKEELPLRAAILLAAALSGICEATCDMAVGYAKLRQQFGQSIGAFQAIKHRCADMKVRAEVAWWQTVLAALSIRDGHADARLQVRAAQLVAADYAVKNAAANIQIHGGIGFTADCNAHHFLKRAHMLDIACGGARRMRADLLTTSAARI